MIKTEMHLHVKGGSPCALSPINEVFPIYKEAGYNAIVLTNHYSLDAFSAYPVEGEQERKQFFIDIYNDFKFEAQKYGIKTFFGVEVRALDKDGYFSEYLLYGIDEKFILESPLLYTLTQRELYHLAEENGLFMAQSHPFRDFVKVGHHRHMHGVEVYNGNPYHIEYAHNSFAKFYAEEFCKVMISGTDFHKSTDIPTGGIYLPEDITTNKELANYLLNNQPKIIKGE